MEHGYDPNTGNPVDTPRLQEQFGYAYDKAWNLQFRTNNAMMETFGVNSLNELTNFSRSGTLTVAGTATEPSGNAPRNAYPGVTNVTVNGQAAVVYGDGSFAAAGLTPADGWNSYTAIAQDNVWPNGRRDTNTVTAYLPASASYTYDLNGNLLSDGTRNFACDDQNELISVWREDYVYDGKLRRRITRQFTWNGSGWQLTNKVHYVYDGNVVIQERDQNNLPVVTYTRGVDLSGSLQGAGGIGGLLARTDMGRLTVNDPLASAYYHADGNGNITALVTGLMDTNQVLVAKYLYDPYGNLLAESGPLAGGNKYRFSSKEWDSPAGLYYYLYRFCDPNLQRWLNRDPLGEPGFELLHGNEPDLLGDGPNLYLYCANNPMLYVDPLGLSFWGDFGNGLNNTVSGIGQSMGQGLYDLSHWQWSQDEYNRIANMMYSTDTPENPAATPYIEGALCVSAAAATTAAALGSLEAAGIIDTAPQGNNVIRIISKPLQRGLRLDKPHHGKWYHWHWWKW